VLEYATANQAPGARGTTPLVPITRGPGRASFPAPWVLTRIQPEPTGGAATGGPSSWLQPAQPRPGWAFVDLVTGHPSPTPPGRDGSGELRSPRFFGPNRDRTHARPVRGAGRRLSRRRRRGRCTEDARRCRNPREQDRHGRQGGRPGNGSDLPNNKHAIARGMMMVQSGDPPTPTTTIRDPPQRQAEN